MELTVRDAMATAMWRFHDAALERAALIYTFARSTNEDTPEGYAIYGRQLPMLIDLVHEFCFNARRAIERAEKYRPGIIANLQALRVHYGKQELVLSELDHPRTVPLTQESFWWVLGRIIHSKETQVMYRTVDVVVTMRRQAVTTPSDNRLRLGSLLTETAIGSTTTSNWSRSSLRTSAGSHIRSAKP